MITNKEEGIDHLAYRLGRSSQWREKLADSFPEDSRNGRAAAKLRALATQCIAIPDAKWTKIAPYFDPTGNRWLAAVSSTNSDIGFRKTPADFDGYLDNLITNLSKPSRH